MTMDIHNKSEIIDSRDVIKRMEELESIPIMDRDEFEQEELDALGALADEGERVSGEWADGVTLILEYYFEDYARELAEDIGAISRDAAWPLSHIDWEAAADALKIDYSPVEFDGETYWIRN